LPLAGQRRPAARHVTGALGELLIEARILLDVRDRNRLTGIRDVPGDPAIDRNTHAEDLILAGPVGNFEF
jgi:hypothetical protein